MKIGTKIKVIGFTHHRSGQTGTVLSVQSLKNTVTVEFRDGDGKFSLLDVPECYVELLVPEPQAPKPKGKCLKEFFFGKKKMTRCECGQDESPWVIHSDFCPLFKPKR